MTTVPSESPSLPYRNTQTGTLVLVALGFALAVVSTALTIAILAEGVSPLMLLVIVFTAIVLVLVGVGFASLTVTVTSSQIHLAFGAGWVHRTIPLSNVRAAVPVRNSWWWGWGVRWTPHGWLWNVSGFDAVEITYLSGKRFRIGTNQPQELAAAINAAKLLAR